jgi:GR25 family glycosyltransferase involved in LPS biosynthesis
MVEPHVYIIHLKHRTDRKEQFESAWAAAELPTDNLHWFPAVEGAKLSNAALANFHTVARTRRARAGRVGCYCSHVAAIEQAISHNHFPLLILEDDAVPAKEIRRPLSALFKAAPRTATLLYFGALPVKDRRAIKNYCDLTKTNKRKTWKHHRSDTQLYGGHAYGFRTAAAATDVLTLLKANKITYDSALVRYQKLHPERIAVHCPFQFYQSEGYSNIEGARREAR